MNICARRFESKTQGLLSTRAVVTGTLEEHYWCFKKIVISSICNSSELNQKVLPKHPRYQAASRPAHKILVHNKNI